MMRKQTMSFAAMLAIGLYAGVAQAGLIAHHNLDETSGTSVADSSGNGNTGTVDGTVDLTAAGVSNTGALFANAVEEGITIAPLFSGNDARSISLTPLVSISSTKRVRKP